MGKLAYVTGVVGSLGGIAASLLAQWGVPSLSVTADKVALEFSKNRPAYVQQGSMPSQQGVYRTLTPEEAQRYGALVPGLQIRGGVFLDFNRDGTEDAVLRVSKREKIVPMGGRSQDMYEAPVVTYVAALSNGTSTDVRYLDTHNGEPVWFVDDDVSVNEKCRGQESISGEIVDGTAMLIKRDTGRCKMNGYVLGQTFAGNQPSIAFSAAARYTDDNQIQFSFADVNGDGRAEEIIAMGRGLYYEGQPLNALNDYAPGVVVFEKKGDKFVVSPPLTAQLRNTTQQLASIAASSVSPQEKQRQIMQAYQRDTAATVSALRATTGSAFDAEYQRTAGEELYWFFARNAGEQLAQGNVMGSVVSALIARNALASSMAAGSPGSAQGGVQAAGSSAPSRGSTSPGNTASGQSSDRANPTPLPWPPPQGIPGAGVVQKIEKAVNEGKPPPEGIPGLGVLQNVQDALGGKKDSKNNGR
ncbi:MAG: hypothetical protein HYY37_04015 [Candidatus Aenigmarchaeota archaeon]|nr:hypothetical protein [Candidatus Aenigmarchaeota archaeon]